ncbi:MAG TPA: alpha/beta hydrolase [Gemmatimonadales bacterium]|nr:alpha/beta hydrolase [Gemmatimonadales bacterium]
MLALRIAVGLGLSYVALALLAWRFQERLAFPAPRAPVPDPQRVGVTNGERVELVSGDGTKLVGWYLKPVDASTNLHHPPPSSPGLLWFYGNGENLAAIWPVVREFQPPGTALLVVDYPGYGGSGGRATEAGLHAAADAAYAMLAARPDVDPRRIYVYGRSLGSAVATYTAAHHPVAGLVLESPFTSARAMARHLYAILPRFTVMLELDNLANVKRIHCPMLVFHGDADRLVPTAMGLAVAAAAGGEGGPAEVVLIPGAGHNDTYTIGGRAYRDKMWQFLQRPVRP